MGYLSPRELQLLEALKTVPTDGLSKQEAGKKIGIAPMMADVFLHLLRSQGYAALTANRYYITQAGVNRLQQAALPGMNL